MMLPLVLLPGTLCDARLWAPQLADLSDVAQCGVGDLSGDESIAGLASSVLDSAPPRFALAGLSLGGIVALEVVRQAPERVVKLALLNTTSRPMRPDQAHVWEERIARARAGQMRAVVDEEILPGWIGAGRGRKCDWWATAEQMARSFSAEVFIRQARANLRRSDSRPILAHLACPTVVIAGRDDALCPVEVHEELAAAIPAARLIVIEQCGHLSTLEQPQAVTAALRDWLHSN
jgi:pimeloyl-ACP methyl ester carboxylesterase